MKKPYEKPMMAIEHFELTQAIASCTGMKIGSMDSMCVMKDSDATPEMKNLAARGYFVEGNCGISVANDDGADGICYHTNINIAFAS